MLHGLKIHTMTSRLALETLQHLVTRFSSLLLPTWARRKITKYYRCVQIVGYTAYTRPIYSFHDVYFLAHECSRKADSVHLHFRIANDRNLDWPSWVGHCLPGPPCRAGLGM